MLTSGMCSVQIVFEEFIEIFEVETFFRLIREDALLAHRLIAARYPPSPRSLVLG